MELSQFTDYSLRVLIYVGVREEKVSVREIADAYGISQHHLVKVVHNLAKLGFLETTRGRNGGIAMGHPPEKIQIGEVVRKVEGFGLVDCFPERDGGCVIDGACALKHALARAKAAFLRELDSYTVADLLHPKVKLQQLLAGAGSQGEITSAG